MEGLKAAVREQSPNTTGCWYAVVTNSDLSEGRGEPVTLLQTRDWDEAKREARGAGVQGGDAEIYARRLVYSDGIPTIITCELLYGRRWSWDLNRYESVEFIPKEEHR